MEPALSRLEGNTSDIIKKLIRKKDLKSLGENEVATFALFLPFNSLGQGNTD